MPDKWKLIYIPTKEMIAYGNYSLCRYKHGLLPVDVRKDYKIVPFTFLTK